MFVTLPAVYAVSLEELSNLYNDSKDAAIIFALGYVIDDSYGIPLVRNAGGIPFRYSVPYVIVDEDLEMVAKFIKTIEKVIEVPETFLCLFVISKIQMTPPQLLTIIEKINEFVGSTSVYIRNACNIIYPNKFVYSCDRMGSSCTTSSNVHNTINNAVCSDNRSYNNVGGVKVIGGTAKDPCCIASEKQLAREACVVDCSTDVPIPRSPLKCSNKNKKTATTTTTPIGFNCVSKNQSGRW